jgi:hypothetical protein
MPLWIGLVLTRTAALLIMRVRLIIYINIQYAYYAKVYFKLLKLVKKLLNFNKLVNIKKKHFIYYVMKFIQINFSQKDSEIQKL